MSKIVRILHVSPHQENDGIAKYQEQYVQAMASNRAVKNVFFEPSPLRLRHMTSEERVATFSRLAEELKEYDILHIQHEFGLFVDDEFKQVVQAGKDGGKKIVVSMHLSPTQAIKQPKLGGLGPHSLLHYARELRYSRRMHQRHVEPLLMADLVLVHTNSTASALQHYGMPAAKIAVLPHPVYALSKPPKTTLVAEKLHKQPGDMIYCTVGMMHRYKGIIDAIKALKFLPSNYKLAIIGGVHPLSEDVPLYNKVCDLIDVLGLHDRVYITGFVEDDQLMNSYIQECDASVFPYSNAYYAHVSSGAINLALANGLPVIAYPTEGFKELASKSNGAIVLASTFAYYELARELQCIDAQKLTKLVQAYAQKMSWPKMANRLIALYQGLV